MSNKKLTLLLLVALAIVLALALNSCSTVHKTSSLHVRQSDSTAITHTAGISVSKTDSTVKVAAFSFLVHDSSGIETHLVHFSFYDDSDAILGPVIIQQAGGNTIINPNGRKIKDVELTRLKTAGIKDSSAKFVQSEIILHKNDSTAATAVADIHVSKYEKDKQTTKDKTGLPFGGWVFWVIIIATLIVGFVFLHKHYSGVKKVADEGEQALKKSFKP